MACPLMVSLMMIAEANSNNGTICTRFNWLMVSIQQIGIELTH